MQLSLDAVRHAARLLREADLHEICLEDVDASGEPQRVLVRRDKAPQFASAPLFPMPQPEAAPQENAPESASQENPMPRNLDVTATAVGLYRQPKTPLAAGDAVKRGQIVAIVESMKVPHEIAAPSDGTVKEILVSDGHGVEYGQALLVLDAAP